MTPELTIIADDFTGALDTGVKLVIAGYSTAVVPFLSGSSCTTQVAVRETSSRHVSASDAKERVMAQVPSTGYVYKKTDSTLRGNVGAELEGLSEAAGWGDIAFVPSYPEIGRTTLHGFQYVDGVPLGDSTYAHDPADPVNSSSVSDIIASQSDIHVVLVASDKPIPDRKQGEPNVFVFDAASEKDLAAIAVKLRTSGAFSLFAGCAGFAAHLPQVTGIIPRNIAGYGGEPHCPTMLVCGSINPQSIAQASNAIRDGWADVIVPAEVLFGRGSAGIDRLASEVSNLIGEGRSVVLRTIRTAEDIQENDSVALRHGISKTGIPGVIAGVLGDIAGACVSDAQVESVLVFGGDTTAALCATLGISEIVPHFEPFPGIIMSTATMRGTELALWTKAGGFGKGSVVADITAVCGGG